MVRPVACLLVVVLLVGGCGGGDPAPTPAADTGEPVEEHGQVPLPVAPTDVPVGQAADVATGALGAYAAPLPYDAWWAGLAPYLSPQARVAYAGVDPAEVPVRELLGAPTLEPQTSAWLAVAVAETDAGWYRVRLSRADDGAWQVDRFEPLATFE